jgi:hypothetical protein
MLKGVASSKVSAAKASACIVTICFDDPKERDWAIETLKSAYGPPPKEDDAR